MNLLSESIKCKSCAEILKQPVFLLCGHSICKRHEKNENRKVECIKCHESFEIPVNGFAPNRDLESLLESEIDELDLGDEYNSALQQLNHFEYLLDQLNRIKNDPETRIHSVLSDLRNKVDLRREELKEEIDKEALKMIEKIDEFEKDCKESIKSDCELDRKLELWENDLTTWKQSLNSFKKDTNKWKSTFDKSTSTMKDLQSEYLKFNDGLFLNRLNELKWPQLSAPRYFETFSVEVDKLSSYKETTGEQCLIEHFVQAVGVNWWLIVNIVVQIEENLQTNNFIKVKLISDINERAENYKVVFDLIFVDQLGMGKSNVKNLSYELMLDKSRDFSHMIKLRDLMEDYNLYNIEKDSCIVQAIIKRIEYF